MKKISRGIGKFFKAIGSFFDRWLITPITKGMLRLSDLFKTNGKSFEKFINNKQTLIVISLIFAFFVFFYVDRNATTIINQSAEILYDQPVTAEYNEEAYVIEGLPESVDITLIGRRADIYLAKQYPSHEVSVDLRELKPGTHRVELHYKQAVQSIDYKLDPSSVTIVVYEKISETRQLDYDVLHRDSLDPKLVISDIKLGRSDVIVKGAEYKLQQVATVKALVDINDLSNPTVGEASLKEVPLIAYDAQGQQLDVEIVPSTVDATITITSPSKEVPVQVVPVGDIAFGKSISEIKTNVSSVLIYGEQSVLDGIEYLPVEINVESLAENREYSVNLVRPNGIRDMSAKTIIIDVTLDEATTKEFTNIQLQPINKGEGLGAQAATEDDAYVTIVVRGSKSVIDALDPTTLKAVVDLSGLKEGTHSVPVQVSGSDLRLTYETKTKNVNIRIFPDSR